MAAPRSGSIRWHLARSGAARRTVGGEARLAKVILGGAALLASCLWCHWATILELSREWSNDSNYSIGQLVPFAALYMAWHHRSSLRTCTLAPSACGAILVLAAQALRGYGLLMLYESAERYALVLTLVGLVWWVGGREVLWRLRWIAAFLFLMIPLPGKIHNALSGPLQGAATTSAVFLLEILGVRVAREGHILTLNDTALIAVAEACSGLRMLTAFVVVGCVAAAVVNRPNWHRTCLVLSTVPIAIVCNVLRLVVTAFLFLHVSRDLAERIFHDFAGWTMMPAAVLLLTLELWVLSRLVVPETKEGDPDNRENVASIA